MILPFLGGVVDEVHAASGGQEGTSVVVVLGGARVKERQAPVDVVSPECLQRKNVRMVTEIQQCSLLVYVASYPGLPLHLYSQPWENTHFFHGCKKNCEGKPGYEASVLLV